MKNELTIQPELKPVAQQPSILTILSAAVEGGVTSENVAVVKELLAMRRDEEAHQAQKDFAHAFAKLQAEMPRIEAVKAVPDNSGGVRYMYAPYTEIMTKARDVLTACGFAITFDTDIMDGRVIATCTLIHTSGHSRSNKFACRIGSGPPKSSEAQGDGAATTYAKRFALCAALNIVVEAVDNDAGREGDEIDKAQADELKALIEETNPPMPDVLAWLGVAHIEALPQEKFQMAKDYLLERKAKLEAKRKNA